MGPFWVGAAGSANSGRHPVYLQEINGMGAKTLLYGRHTLVLDVLVFGWERQVLAENSSKCLS